MTTYKNTRAWLEAFANFAGPEASALAQAYDNAWIKACKIADQIKGDAAGLTLHDEKHFTALWRAVDLLLPSSIVLTPTEAFILGTAVLIHDAAHTILAYEGGFATIAETPEWGDNVAGLWEEEGPVPSLSDLSAALKREALFSTLRSLHAKHAPKLLKLAFKHPSFGSDDFLINDPAIRNHMSEVIGNVAASHHWDHGRVAELPKNSYVAAPYDVFGPVRTLLLAALMRTADAIQIDNQRAPDFEFTLIKPEGVSLDHWIAQSRLAIGRDHDDSTALLVNSTAAFPEEAAPAWWVAYELAGIADRELQTTNALLLDLGQPQLALLRVKDVADPSRFSRHVRTDGWIPLKADIKVGKTSDVVALLGGKGLYGDDIVVPLRELVQNAIDAVRARRLLDKDYQGRIVVRLEKGTNESGEGGYWLTVADDGIGMSSSILTGPFLTFGESGWSSDTLRGERPGFMARRFRHIGRYGIGFFSVFMFSDEVKVSSRRYEAGLDQTKQLYFRAGLGLRPMLRTDQNPTSRTVTRIEAFLNEGAVQRLMKKSDETLVLSVGKPGTKKAAETYSMLALLGLICPAIDVDIEAFDSDTSTRGTIDRNWFIAGPKEWLHRINGGVTEIPKVILEYADLMRPLGPKEAPTGRAALSPVKIQVSSITVGGLANKRSPSVTTGTNFFGTMDRAPEGPKREPHFPADNAYADWASEQAILWAAANLLPQERNLIAANAAYFGGDPTPVANALIDGKWLNAHQIVDLLETGAAVKIPVTLQSMRGGDTWSVMGHVNLRGGFVYHPDEIQLESQDVMTSGQSADIYRYWAIPDEGWPEDVSIVGTLSRIAAARDRTLELRGENYDYGHYKGPTIPSQRRTQGDRIVLPTFMMTLKPTD